MANWIYIWAHWPVIASFAVWIWFRDKEGYRTFRNALLLSGAVGLVIFALFPVAPPRLVPDWGFVDTVTDRSHSYRVLQPSALTNQYAAMPSLHFGWDLLVGIALVRSARFPLLRLVGVLLPIAMFASIVLTANHFVLDGVAGGAVALTGLTLATAFMPRESESARRGSAAHWPTAPVPRVRQSVQVRRLSPTRRRSPVPVSPGWGCRTNLPPSCARFCDTTAANDRLNTVRT